MKNFLIVLSILTLFTQPSFAWNWGCWNNEEYAVEKLLKAQVKYANNANYNKFINTYDPKYINGDGLNLDVYSKLVKDIWQT